MLTYSTYLKYEINFYLTIFNPSGKYRPDKAFELRVKWSVATGALITDLVSNWARKA